MGTKNDMTLINQFGEESINQVITIDDSFSNKQPAKAGVTAITAIATADATDLATALVLVNELKANFNSLLAALKAVS